MEPRGWEPPTPRICELMRLAAERVINLPQDWLDELHTATLASDYMPPAIVGDPVLAGEVRRSNRANQLHWAAANIGHPGEPVPANVGADSLAIARDLIRRGLDESALLDAYRIGHNVAWRQWMQVVFELTSDAIEQRELLELSARSITAFIDATIAGIHRQLRIERDDLIRGTHAERREIVALIIHGAAITEKHAENKLGYHLGQCHTAAVIWGDESDTDLADLDRAAEALTHTVGGPRPLSVLADAATRWVWVPGHTGPDLDRVCAAVDQLPGVRITLGPTVAGIDGFRRSHLDAITTERIMARLGAGRRVASFADVELAALVTADPESAQRFIKHTLGDFATADPELQRTVLTFVHEQCNASRAATRLFTHRNTLLNRLTRANELLPQPLEHSSVKVAVALEALRWGNAGR
ncbi:PucR family transcriptional regulator [Mycolicibacterium mucogenicum]|uniref:PucR family transcriptional regulator n=1 Tax=Mycolicibacterium mucogenicum TaxID=56689 RepID=UPI00076AA65B|nr:PucR family transcriptional regulator [Mycolicibacterium mucogenicum]